MTLREKLVLAGYRLRAAAAHMPTEWQKAEVLRWANDAVRASGMEARRAASEAAVHDSPAPKGDAQTTPRTPPDYGGNDERA